MTARTPSSWVPLAAQSREEPEPYSLPAITISGTFSLRYASDASKIVVLLAVRQMCREAALDAGHQQILEADIGEGPAHHHFVIAAAGAVGIEILGLDAVGDQITAGWTRQRESNRQARCGRW